MVRYHLTPTFSHLSIHFSFSTCRRAAERRKNLIKPAWISKLSRSLASIIMIYHIERLLRYNVSQWAIPRLRDGINALYNQN
jgi:hypothetical protein